nr:immunoglobulin heavy chain junction region [Macaca mulatta]MOW99881.1 immunoglobulin heavy chain junction region [Macaca mulatta]MOX00130.1 immunoglobulin heavy chain junction region [Macaca mulatta]MOX00295.1 immunoglobulin heavy chain junction region [Macaca mulatta]MOX02112.1 immunoglobulin heavy chain junction region [Macaca mulatta]
CAREQSNFDYW